MSKKAAIPVAIAALLIAGFLVAESYPHAFPRKGATKIFENERLFIWDATWPIGVDQPIHQHKYDMAGVFLRYGKIKVTSLDGKANIAAAWEAPRPLFQAKGVTHTEEAVGNPGDPERHAIMVDLKEYTPPPFTPKPGLETSFPREGATDSIESPRVRIWDYTWLPKKPVAMHVHDKDSVEVFVGAGTLLTKFADGHEDSKTVAYGTARFVPRGQVDTEEAVSGSPRAYIIELK